MKLDRIRPIVPHRDSAAHLQRAIYGVLSTMTNRQQTRATIPVIAAILCTLGASLAPAQEWPSARRGYQRTLLAGDRLEQRFYRWGDAILVDNVMINGRGPFRFLLDTGAQGAGRVDRALAERLELPVVGERPGVGLFGETHDMTVHRVESLVIGNLRFTDVEMSSRDYSELVGPGLRPFDGILGYHLFNEYLLTINYPARMLSVSHGELPHADGEHVIDIVGDNEQPEVVVSIGDAEVQVLLDTGAQTSIGVSSAVAERLTFTREPRVLGRQNGAEIRTGIIDGAVRIGAIEYPNPRAVISDMSLKPVIGTKLIASLSLTFDQKNSRLRVDRPDPMTSYGISLAWGGRGPWRFGGVLEDSIAELAGLRGTDRIVSMNGTLFESVNREDMFRMLDDSPLELIIERDGARVELLLGRE